MKPTIFMIHGSGAGKWTWEDFINYYEKKGYRCIAENLPYHGQLLLDGPDPRLARLSLLDYVKFLEDSINKLGKMDGPLIIMGHSMGGLLAQIISSHGFGEALVLLAPAPPHGINLTNNTLEETIGLLFENRANFEKSEKMPYEACCQFSFNRIPPSEWQRRYLQLGYESGRVALEVGFACLDPNKTSYVDQTCVTCPVLVLVGKEDRRVPPSVVCRIAEKYAPHSEYHEFENHAHWLLLEPQWEDVADHIHNWLESLRLKSSCLPAGATRSVQLP